MYPLVALIAVVALVVAGHTGSLVLATVKPGATSAFGRPLKDGPGFPKNPEPPVVEESEAPRTPPEKSAKKSDEPVSAFGRPLRPGPGRSRS